MLSARLVVLTLAVLSLGSCETSRKGGGFPEVSSPMNEAGTAESKDEKEVTKQVAAVIEGKIEYSVSRDQLAQAFIREFRDGTVVDKVMVRKVQSSPKVKATYYIVALGLLNGSFRGMALPLKASTDNSLYLSANAERYILTATGCPFCYFTFEKDAISGTSCEDNSGGSRCDIVVKEKNTLFVREVPAKQTPAP